MFSRRDFINLSSHTALSAGLAVSLTGLSALAQANVAAPVTLLHEGRQRACQQHCNTATGLKTP